MSRLSANLCLLMAAAIWGGGFVAQSSAMAFVGAGWFTGLRFSLAFLAVAPFGVMEARHAGRTLAPRDRWAMLPLGLVFCAATLLQQFAIETTSVTHVGFLTGLYVIFVPGLETLVSRRVPHPVIWMAVVLAMSGTWFLSGGLDSLTRGDLLTIVAALGFAVQIILLDRFVQRTSRPVAAALVQSLCCVLVGTLFGVMSGPLVWTALPAALPELLYAGVFSAGAAFLIQAIAQQYTLASDAAVMLMSESLFAALFAALILGERLSADGWIGCGLLFTSLILAQIGPLLLSRGPVVAGPRA